MQERKEQLKRGVHAFIEAQRLRMETQKILSGRMETGDVVDIFLTGAERHLDDSDARK